jgi:O-antigen ligase
MSATLLVNLPTSSLAAPKFIDSSMTEPSNDGSLAYSLFQISKAAEKSSPFIGHGTGSTKTMFAQNTGMEPTAPGVATNPHNQVLAIAIPLGLTGVVLLLAMWVAHLRMFMIPGHAAWIGVSVVTQNIVASLFNSRLFNFAQGWLYVFGVGIAGGILLRKQNPKQAATTARVMSH